MQTVDRAVVMLDFLKNVAIEAARLAERPPPGWTSAQLAALARGEDERLEEMYESASEDVQGAYDKLQEEIEAL